ncbi:MAG: bifunctional oligoribonuclease/PAP phosphatase NrnA [Muribaculaceae bacterium]|nr:bifunctional oligoribonuclease/PAP phosphatase NrnA [Muribaculaceae bacterium]
MNIYLKQIVDNKLTDKLRSLIGQAERIVITCHTAPDGDALGSSLALMHLLNNMGKIAHVVTPDVPTESLRFIPGAKEIVPFTRYEDFAKELFEKADLVIGLDFNAIKRLDRMAHLMENASAPKALIDHHLYPEQFADVTISHPEQSSTCMLLFRIICQMGWTELIDKKIASCIYTGMMTDTGNFTYNDSDPEIYLAIAHLVDRGVDKDNIYKLAFNTKSENQLKLNAYAIAEKMTIFPEHGAALITLDKSELERFGYKKGDTEGLVNKPLAIPGVQYSVFLREGDDYTKVSCRSIGHIPVDKLCSDYFNGGGHENAAGGEFPGSLQQAVETFLNAANEFDKYINTNDK